MQTDSHLQAAAEPAEAPGTPIDLPNHGKVRSIAELADIAHKLRTSGFQVVLAHGVFDLLHLGHVRHLTEAKNNGDVLMVTISADQFVNKGPGRPVFTEALRAEMLAALSIVDYVAISRNPGAEAVIEALRPSVYVKGSEYMRPEQDVTGRIVSERQAVERHGGRLVFTDDITFSSSTLLNRHFSIYPPDLQEYLAERRQSGMLDQLTGLIDRIAGMRVLFVGDTILDEYQYVEPMGKSAKEHIIATRYVNTEVFCGGVIAAANTAADFCREVDVVTVLGDHDSREDLIRSSLKSNVTLHAIHRADAPTTRKCRMVDPAYTRKLFEVCFINDTPLDSDAARQLNHWLGDRLGSYDVIVVTDFGHGMINRPTIDLLCRKAPFLAVNAQTNSANTGFNLITRYPRADYICIDAPEARMAAGVRHQPLEEIIVDGLAGTIDCPRFMITHGPNGCLSYDRNRGLGRIPAFTRSVVDTMGAGDAFLAVTSPLAATGADLDSVGFVGNAVGALKVGIVGHRKSVDRAGVVKTITAMLK
ncbi:PfkB family carbohydrate kinase [Azospirillum halopraeferens]|uniref:PfkB family carbohydrate kinase n=1 Tax=Azospirillum halopraeferens TaxID=34010 RepID=UPI00040B1CD0|nr:PfkB family carbohydrate kinase [Azospirillum halopraeferens]